MAKTLKSCMLVVPTTYYRLVVVSYFSPLRRITSEFKQLKFLFAQKIDSEIFSLAPNFVSVRVFMCVCMCACVCVFFVWGCVCVHVYMQRVHIYCLSAKDKK